ncbi:MAPEG family protein [Methylobacter marinus]|jgi:glutathione S-transferase|uniref:MAPEG family protein n=1 Tax=Methylobacter marinus TaxID=34058 RepID=UPI0003803881
MNFVHVVAVLAVLQFFLFGILVGRARAKHDVRPPSTSGNEQFERAFRVQMNTMEQLVGFLPALFIASHYWPNSVVAAVGAVYLIGRFLYRHLYITDPAKRQPGFVLTVVPTFILLIASLVGSLGLYIA